MTNAAVLLGYHPGPLPYEAMVNTLGNTDTLTPAATELADGDAPDAYYNFTPLDTGVYTFEVDLATGGLGVFIDVALGVYTGDCGSLTEIGSVDEGNCHQ
jgi:hypothetical protein